MAAVVQVNFVVADLERSRGFYQRLGFTFRSRSRQGVETAEAWVSIDAGVTIVLHSPKFTSWWDPSTPGPAAGGSQIDLEVDSSDLLEAVVGELRGSGATIAKQPVDMSWGQRFAIVIDPDRTQGTPGGNRVAEDRPGIGRPQRRRNRQRRGRVQLLCGASWLVRQSQPWRLSCQGAGQA